MAGARRQALHWYRRLQRTRLKVFSGDEDALLAARKRLREEFDRNRSENDPDRIKNLLEIAEATDAYLRQNVVQGKLMNDGYTYRFRLTDDTTPTIDFGGSKTQKK
ncbi:complex III assembly factor LYRM7-like [Oscarella lobularis]|uniref:complex III assembly factor LYRM7-like n=1 Tax=Oscarella lobularis TaxID=121494 RepID=UPI00331338C3